MVFVCCLPPVSHFHEKSEWSESVSWALPYCQQHYSQMKTMITHSHYRFRFDAEASSFENEAHGTLAIANALGFNGSHYNFLLRSFLWYGWIYRICESYCVLKPKNLHETNWQDPLWNNPIQRNGINQINSDWLNVLLRPRNPKSTSLFRIQYGCAKVIGEFIAKKNLYSHDSSQTYSSNISHMNEIIQPFQSIKYENIK